MKKFLPWILSTMLLPILAAQTEESGKGKPADKPAAPFSAETFTGLKLREIGPALTSGRIGDLAVVPGRPSTWYVAVASGGVWKTVNAGTTWTPIFDGKDPIRSAV